MKKIKCRVFGHSFLPAVAIFHPIRNYNTKLRICKRCKFEEELLCH